MPLIQSLPVPRFTQVHAQLPHDSDSQDCRFLKLLADLRPYGGMLPVEEVRSIGFVQRAGLSLGESLIQRDLFALTWRHRLWLPIFQFRLPSWELSTPVSGIVVLFHPVVQGFELTEWFVTPNGWLNEKCPLDVIDTHTAHVRHAAQADRFLLAG